MLFPFDYRWQFYFFVASFLILSALCFFKFRNDLYLVIERGDFERGGKSSNKNIEVTAIVVDEFGNHLQVLKLFVIE